MLRKGEVRINGGRVKQGLKLRAGDVVRIPPAHFDEADPKQPPAALVRRIQGSIIHEDERFLAINKPPGISVHSGSRDPFGAIEALRAARPELENLQLVHRLDRMTSGCLLFCKRGDVLREVHQALRTGQVDKRYLALIRGRPRRKQFSVEAALSAGNLRSGERMVSIDSQGKQAHSDFRVVRLFKTAALAEVQLLTGRTHQIRVHAAHVGHPLAMDMKYGDRDFNKNMKALGLKRIFLHANSLTVRLESLEKPLQLTAELSDDLQTFMATPGLNA